MLRRRREQQQQQPQQVYNTEQQSDGEPQQQYFKEAKQYRIKCNKYKYFNCPVFVLVVLLALLLLVSSVIGTSIDTIYTGDSTSSDSNDKHENKHDIGTNGGNATPNLYQEDDTDTDTNTDMIGSAVESHPDPNEENYPNMIYVGRIDYETGKRLSADHDNTIRYIFGTAFDNNHQSILEIDLHHRTGHHIHDIPDVETKKTIQQLIKERDIEKRHGNVTHAKIVGPKPFGHVDINDVDGGVTPPIPVEVEPFFIDETLVTNKEFAKFVQSTYYETEAEQYGWSYVLSSFVSDKEKDRIEEIENDPDAEHWIAVPGAYWRQPEGTLSSYKHREYHPVVHVSHRDAAEYCAWMNKRLPGEREWEAAARANQWYNKTPAQQLSNRYMYIWQNSTTTDNDNDNNINTSFTYANLWGNGEFPYVNYAEDGWRGTSPVTYYNNTTQQQNILGIYDMIGNVWEWMRGGKLKSRIVRGGSYVDTVSGIYNHAATLGIRSTIHGTTTTGNVGFRCCKSIKKRIEHHYVWHDSSSTSSTNQKETSKLSIHDQYGKEHIVPERGWEDHTHKEYDHHYYPDDDDDDDENNDSNMDEDYIDNEEENESKKQKSTKKKKRREKVKVIKKYERLSNEL